MHLTQEEKDYLTRLGARVVGDNVYDDKNNLATDDDLKQILDDARKQGHIRGNTGGGQRSIRRPRNIIDADYTIVDEDSDDSEEGYENQRQYRKARGSNRSTTHRSGYSAPQTRSEAEDVDYGYIPTTRENRTARQKLIKEQRAAAKEEKSQKQRKIRQYAINEMKYPGRISFLNRKSQPEGPKSEARMDRKQWCAIDCNPTTGKGLTVMVCSSREEARKQAEKMMAGHGATSKYTQKIAYTEPTNIKSNGSFKKKPNTVYKIDKVV